MTPAVKMAREALKWAITYIADGYDFDAGETPAHECGFNTDTGHCEFHKAFFGAVESLRALKAEDEAEKCPNQGCIDGKFPLGHDGSTSLVCPWPGHKPAADTKGGETMRAKKADFPTVSMALHLKVCEDRGKIMAERDIERLAHIETKRELGALKSIRQAATNEADRLAEAVEALPHYHPYVSYEVGDGPTVGMGVDSDGEWFLRADVEDILAAYQKSKESNRG